MIIDSFFNVNCGNQNKELAIPCRISLFLLLCIATQQTQKRIFVRKRDVRGRHSSFTIKSEKRGGVYSSESSESTSSSSRNSDDGSTSIEPSSSAFFDTMNLWKEDPSIHSCYVWNEQVGWSVYRPWPIADETHHGWGSSFSDLSFPSFDLILTEDSLDSVLSSSEETASDSRTARDLKRFSIWIR